MLLPTALVLLAGVSAIVPNTGLALGERATAAGIDERQIRATDASTASSGSKATPSGGVDGGDSVYTARPSGGVDGGGSVYHLPANQSWARLSLSTDVQYIDGGWTTAKGCVTPEAYQLANLGTAGVRFASGIAGFALLVTADAGHEAEIAVNNQEPGRVQGVSGAKPTPTSAAESSDGACGFTYKFAFDDPTKENVLRIYHTPPREVRTGTYGIMLDNIVAFRNKADVDAVKITGGGDSAQTSQGAQATKGSGATSARECAALAAAFAAAGAVAAAW
ncbi:hypothetical protein Q8F55_003324 [Vanrija albida]|uniref:Uncharacterized protein n=1 Tax=Vanrija albida TaxID=181172 RepID=A0ABR3Q4H0_9TREE